MSCPAGVLSPGLGVSGDRSFISGFTAPGTPHAIVKTGTSTARILEGNQREPLFAQGHPASEWQTPKHEPLPHTDSPCGVEASPVWLWVSGWSLMSLRSP